MLVYNPFNRFGPLEIWKYLNEENYCEDNKIF